MNKWLDQSKGTHIQELKSKITQNVEPKKSDPNKSKFTKIQFNMIKQC